MKLKFNLLIFIPALMLASSLFAVNSSAQTPDSFIAQISSSERDTFATDISGDGRFVVFESTGNIATQDPDNADGNLEIFLYDYAQRRVFQITNTLNARRDGSRPFSEASNIAVEVSNNRPVISNDGRFIVFSSNAINPASFIGDNNRAALEADGNQEIFIYEIPQITNINLTTGETGQLIDLRQGNFTRITDTPASRRPTPAQPGSSTSLFVPAFVAFDNRDAAVNDDATLIAFVSTRNFAGTNADFNPEIFVYNRLTGAVSQITNTTGAFDYNENPSLSGTGAVMAFISNANIAAAGSGNADENSEVYVANLNVDSGTVASIRQLTRTALPSTTDPTANLSTINVFSPGRHVSRDGNLVAFESRAELAGNSSTLQATRALFVYNVAANAFTQVGPRATSSEDVFRFPTFTGDSSTLIFTSALNFRESGDVPGTASEGLNPNRTAQVFSTSVNSLRSFARLTNTPAAATGTTPGLQPLASNTTRRIAFSIPRTEFGGGNADNSTEAFYLNVSAPPSSDTPASEGAVSFLTGASRRTDVSSLAPGMLAIVRANGTTALAPASGNAAFPSETLKPSLPIELNGVSISVGGAAAGLSSVSQNEIQFVVPPGLAPTTGTNTLPVVINNNGAVIRSAIQLTPAQPDIFVRGENRAAASNLSGAANTDEPFTVTTVTPSGETVPTVLFITLTGVRNVQRNQVTAIIGGMGISGEENILSVDPLDLPGFYGIRVRLPASLAGYGDSPVAFNVTIGGQTYSSRLDDTAPRIRIN